VVLADFFVKRRGHIDVEELYREPERSAYGDVNWGGIAAFVAGLIAGWTVEDASSRPAGVRLHRLLAART